MRHFLSIAETPPEELRHVLDVARRLRARRDEPNGHSSILHRKTLVIIFEKPSLRTRVSFEQAMYELGGQAMTLAQHEVGLGKRETPGDVARVLGGMVQGIAARVYEHEKLIEMAGQSPVPVINALSDYMHPCQALADALTIMDEFGDDVSGRKVAFVGDGNNVARSLGAVCGKLGMRYAVAAPRGFEVDPPFVRRLKELLPGDRLLITTDPREAVRGADVVYTDTWVSMGQEDQAAERRAVFGPYQVDAGLLRGAPAHAIVLHCLPAYRGFEIASDVLDGPQSRVFPQAHNRLHAQKGLLAVLMGGA